MKLSAKLYGVKDLKCDVLVVGMFEGAKTLSPLQAELDKTLGALFSDYLLKKEAFEPKFGETFLLPTYSKIGADKILVLGLGKKDALNRDKLRDAAARAFRAANCIAKNKKVVIEMFADDTQDNSNAMAEGILISSYEFNKYKTKPKPSKISSVELLTKHTVERANTVVGAMKFSRDLVNEPAHFATPSKIAEIAQSFEKEFTNLSVKVYGKKELEAMGFGAFLAVSLGSSQEPKFVHVTYSPKTAKRKVAIIGKGITFDSGGLNIKPAASMLTMKTDMAGCAAVLGAIRAIATLKPDAEVHALAAVCENMPGSEAYKLGDILVAKNGKTIELDNTDAEGRLTLADVLCYADTLGVDEVIDIATLTGACVVALGNNISGIMSKNQKMVDKLIEVGKKSGEALWQLPMTEDMHDALKSDVADMTNTGKRGAGASTAAVFLSNFVKNKNWAHIDIAGTAFSDKCYRELGKGATGVMVRTLVNYITNS